MTREEKNKKFSKFSALLDQFADLRNQWRYAESHDLPEHQIWLQLDAVRMEIWRMIDDES